MSKFELTLEPKITREILLSKHSQETYFEHYLGVPVKKGLFKSPSVIRPDKDPTCSFYKTDKGILKYKDFAGPTFDFIGCVMYLFSCNYYRALRIIANDFGILELKNVEKNTPLIEYSGSVIEVTQRSRINVEVKDWTEKELNWWSSFGITLNTLNRFNVFSIKSIFLNNVYYNDSSDSSPVYGYYGGLSYDEDELWRLYMPTKRTFRFLTNWPASMIQGLKQIPNEGEFIVVTKSLKDVMALYEFGIPAIAPNSEGLFLSDDQLHRLRLRFKTVYLLYDRDLPGVRSAKKIKKKHPCVKVLLTPKVKDFTDFVKKYGIKRTEKLVDQWLRKNNHKRMEK